MKILLTILIFVLTGFVAIGIIHGSPSIVLTNFSAVEYEAGVSLVISLCAGLIVSSLYDRV